MFQNEDKNYRLKIAFDFDDTLTDPLFEELAKRFISKGHDVWIVTVRTSYETYLENCQRFHLPPQPENERNADLKELAKSLGISDKVIYTNSETKDKVFFEQGFDLLFDDDDEWHCNPICKKGGLAVVI